MTHQAPGPPPIAFAPPGRVPFIPLGGAPPFTGVPFSASAVFPGYGPGFPGPPPVPRINGFGAASLVTGGLSLLIAPLVVVPLVVIGVLSIVGGGVGIALGLTGLVRGSVGTVGGKGLAVAGAVTSCAAVVTAAVLLALTGLGPLDGASSDHDTAADEWVDLPAVALRPGVEATVGDFTVTVTQIDMDADDAIAAAVPENTGPRGRYVEVSVTAVYIGSTSGDPLDLLVAYVGGDAWLYDESDCEAQTTRPVWDVGYLRPGDAAEYSVCLDVPLGALDGSAVVVEDLTSKRFTSIMWSDD